MLRVFAALVVSGLLVPAPALSEVLRGTTIPVTVEGNVNTQFHPAGPGACPGMCLSGNVTWSPGRDGFLSIYEERHGRELELEGYLFSFGGFLEGSGPRTAARVVRDRGAGPPGLCVDTRTQIAFSLEFSAGERSSLKARLFGGDPTLPTLLQTRCGGPLDGDVAPALPEQPIDLATLLRGGATIDLSAERPFLGGGLAGTVSSSVKLMLGRPLTPFEKVRLPGASESRTPGFLSVTAEYRIERVAGSLVTSFNGGAERLLCAPLDACGASGALRVRPLASSGKAAFTALSFSKRVTRPQLRAALGLERGRRVRGISTVGDAEWVRGTGSVTGSFNAGNLTCSDTVGLDRDRLSFSFGRRRVFASYGRANPYGGDPFGTRCPGPALADLTQDHPLLTGAVPLRAFRKKRVVITLAGRRPFESEPYRGQTSGTLTVVLRRTGIGRPSGDGVLVIRRAARRSGSSGG
jgi:hypothetical protein